MNILIINYEFPPLGGGGSPVSYSICKGYAQAGHHVDVVTMAYDGLHSYENKDGINIHRVKCWRKSKAKCTVPEMASFIIPGYRKALDLCNQRQYDINHTHFIIPSGIISRRLKRKTGLRYVITAHGSDVIGYNKRFAKVYPFIKRAWKRIIDDAEEIITPSDFLAREIKIRHPEAKTVTIHNGLDSKQYPASQQREDMILTAARLFPNKGIQDLIAAAEKIDLEEWKIHIVGDGPYKGTLEEQVRAAGLDNEVIFHGWLDNKGQKMKNLYSKAKIFILPSHKENLSMALLEALSSGCHVLTTNAGGNPEVVQEDNLFEPKDPISLAKTLASAMKKTHAEGLPKQFHINTINKQYEQEMKACTN